MIDNVILDIAGSDDYTDYLFMTAALTNSRVAPLLNPTEEELRRMRNGNSFVFKCRNSRKELAAGDRTVAVDEYSHTIVVLSRIYLDDEGNISIADAEIVRDLIRKAVTGALESSWNLKEVYRFHFPTFWAARERIYANPRFFYARTGMLSTSTFREIPLGVALKAIERAPDLFIPTSFGGCRCKEGAILVDYEYAVSCAEDWTMHTWCPDCGARREFKVRNFDLEKSCSSFLAGVEREFDNGVGVSGLGLFEVIDALASE